MESEEHQAMRFEISQGMISLIIEHLSSRDLNLNTFGAYIHLSTSTFLLKVLENR